jgi:hypothetical protein
MMTAERAWPKMSRICSVGRSWIERKVHAAGFEDGEDGSRHSYVGGTRTATGLSSVLPRSRS